MLGFTKTGSTSNFAFGAPINFLDANGNGVGDICENASGVFSLAAPSLLFNMYPNPASSEVNVSFGTDLPDAVHVEITDVTGKIVATKSMDQGIYKYQTLALPVGALSPGMYFVSVRSGQARKMQQLAIMRN